MNLPACAQLCIRHLRLIFAFILLGQDDYDRLRPLSYQEANLVLVCFDVTNPTSSENVLIKVIISSVHQPEYEHSYKECHCLTGVSGLLFSLSMIVRFLYCNLLAMINSCSSACMWTLTSCMQGFST